MLKLKGPSNVSQMVYAPEGRHLITIGGSSTAATVWNIQDGKIVQKIYTLPFRGRKYPAIRLHFLFSNELVILHRYCGYEFPFWKWPVVRNDTPTLLALPNYCLASRTVQNQQKILMISGSEIFLWDATHREFQRIESGFQGLNVVPSVNFDGTLLIFQIVNRQTTLLTNSLGISSLSEPTQILHSINLGVEITNSVFHPSRNDLVLGYEKGFSIYDANTGKPIVEKIEIETNLCGVEYTPDGRYLITASVDGTIRIFKTETYTEAYRLDFEIGDLTCLAVSHDSLTFAVAAKKQMIVVADLDA